MNIKNISNDLIIDNGLTRELVEKWNIVAPKLKENAVAREIDISPVQAEKYIFDLYGFFKNEIAMRESHIYPHIIVNGYKSSSDFDGTNLKILILDESKVATYYKLLTKKKKITIT